jgi:hypothetical protein
MQDKLIRPDGIPAENASVGFTGCNVGHAPWGVNRLHGASVPCQANAFRARSDGVSPITSRHEKTRFFSWEVMERKAKGESSAGHGSINYIDDNPLLCLKGYREWREEMVLHSATA